MPHQKSDLRSAFQQQFGADTDPLIVRSPGRVNIIGEHTDYNQGFVLPAAIDLETCVVAAKRSDDLIRIFAVQYNAIHEVKLAEVQRTHSWTDYVLGVVAQLQQRGLPLTGFNMLIDGNVPAGAGLSSSAALEAATLFALNEFFGYGFSRMEMAHIAQQAEHAFAGVKCGIMDMFASLHGKKDHAIRLDCRSLAFEYVPLRLDGYKIVLLNTNVKHNLAGTEYNTRRQQCEQGVTWVKDYHPEVDSLRDVTIEMLDTHVKSKDPLVYQRCRFVVEENTRVMEACKALQSGELNKLGAFMAGSHLGLSRDYEVSCKELDLLVELVKSNPAVLGARMMGGGFGGCTINIVKEDQVQALVDSIKPVYESQTGLPLTVIEARIEAGTSIV